jgi:hypothetical protein
MRTEGEKKSPKKRGKQMSALVLLNSESCLDATRDAGATREWTRVERSEQIKKKSCIVIRTDAVRLSFYSYTTVELFVSSFRSPSPRLSPFD